MQSKKKKNTHKKNNSFEKKNFNHEILGLLILAAGVLIFFSFYIDNSIGPFGTLIKNIMLGVIGATAFMLPPIIIVYGVFIIFKKDSKVFKLRILYLIILMVLISSFVQTGFYKKEDYEGLNIATVLAKFYNDGINLQGGGLIGGIVSIPFLSLFKPLGTIVILVTASIIDIILLTNISIASFAAKIRKSFQKSIKSYRDKTKEKDIGFESELFEQPPEIDPLKANVIDFELEKSNRGAAVMDLDLKAASPDVKKEDSVEIIDMLISDAKKNRQKKHKNSSSAVELETIKVENTVTNYNFPPFDLLNYYSSKGKNIRLIKSEAMEKARILEETLGSFGVRAKVINVSRGPTVTRYELQPSTGVKVSRIVNLSDDIALNLAASGVRIEAPIPGKAAIGIEVPNNEVSIVSLREVVESSDFSKYPSKLTFALGKDISGQCVIADISKMPHLLIAGATGSGKSVCINSLIVSLLYKASPEEVRLLLIDPKVVELGIYNGIPHLLIPVVTEPKKAAGALNWAVQEMINRYKLFADKGVRDIDSYNDLVKKQKEEASLPNIVIIIDELADLMMVAPNDVEDAICRLAQMARAAGMHLVVATQRPSVNVITGVIKANIPSRISFAVTSQVDSRTILDMGGAEKLLGKGDMLYFPVGTPKPTRVQGALVTDEEIEKLVDFLKIQGEVDYNNHIIEEINSQNETTEEKSSDYDELLPSAIEMVVEAGQASVSLIQRKFKVGYARAARIIDQMEERGIVGGFEGSKPRQVLITKQQFQELNL